MVKEMKLVLSLMGDTRLDETFHADRHDGVCNTREGSETQR